MDTNRNENERRKNGHGVIKTVIAVVIALLLMFGISAGVANHFVKKAAVPASNIPNGLSAYELAVQNGFDGSLQDWLKSLSGKSAYEIAKDNGYTGTESEWVKLVENNSQNTATIKSSYFSGDNLIIKLSDGTEVNLGSVRGPKGADGKDGANGVNGKDGVDGQNGADGTGVTSVYVDDTNQFIINLSDGSEINLGAIAGINGADGKSAYQVAVDNGFTGTEAEWLDSLKGADGVNGTNGTNGTDGNDGVGIENISIDTDGKLKIRLTSGTLLDLGIVKGADGQNGTNGTDGKSAYEIAQDNGYTGTETEWLASLIGANGTNGTNGTDGVGIDGIAVDTDGKLTVTLTNGNTIDLGVIKGDKGDKGDKGADGTNGTNGADGKSAFEIAQDNGYTGTVTEWLASLNGTNGTNGTDGRGVSGVEINPAGELVLTFTDSTFVNLGNIKGADGQNGTNGKSAYEIAVDNGYTGTETEWLASLIGANGTDGTNGTNGTDGADGVGIDTITVDADGKLIVTLTNGSTVDLGVIKGADGVNGINGTNGTNGVDGKSAFEIAQDNGYTGTATEWLETLKGADGQNGTNGTDGADGIGIQTVEIETTGNLKVTLTNGTVLNLGNIKGTDGLGISASQINALGELVLTYTDGTSTNLGKVVGDNGTNGTNGTDGVGIQSVDLSATGDLSVTLTNGTTSNLGNIKGEKGDKGDKGYKGDKGETGATGATGKGIESWELEGVQYKITYTDGTVQYIDTPYSPFKFTLNSAGTAYHVSSNPDCVFAIKNLIIPSTYNGKDVVVVSNNSFANNQTITSVYIPKTITEIQWSAFENCTALTSVEFENDSNIWLIGTKAFDGCTKLNSINFPEGLFQISESAFRNCTSLTTINIPSSVRSIMWYAFHESGLTSVTFADATGWECSKPRGSDFKVGTQNCYTLSKYIKRSSDNTVIYTIDLSNTTLMAKVLATGISKADTGLNHSGTIYYYYCAWYKDIENPQYKDGILQVE